MPLLNFCGEMMIRVTRCIGLPGGNYITLMNEAWVLEIFTLLTLLCLLNRGGGLSILQLLCVLQFYVQKILPKW